MCIYALLAAWTPAASQQTCTKEPAEELGTGVSLNQGGSLSQRWGPACLRSKGVRGSPGEQSSSASPFSR